MKLRQSAIYVLMPLILFTFSACSGGSGASGGSPTSSGATPFPTIGQFPTVAQLPTVAAFPTVPELPTVPPLSTVAPQATAASQPTAELANTAVTQLTAASPSATLSTEGTSKILIQDDFSDPASGWQNQKIDCCQFEYNNGAYRILATQANTVAFSLFPKQTYGDASLEVDVAESAGPASAIYGLACRVSSNFDKGYVFAIRPDTAHVIFMVTGSTGQKELNAVLKSDAIHPGPATNHLRADCIGSQLSFYANGQKLMEAQDTQYQSGQIGMVVSTQLDAGGADVSFDNFVAREPSP